MRIADAHRLERALRLPLRKWHCPLASGSTISAGKAAPTFGAPADNGAVGGQPAGVCGARVHQYKLSLGRRRLSLSVQPQQPTVPSARTPHPCRCPTLTVWNLSDACGSESCTTSLYGTGDPSRWTIAGRVGRTSPVCLMRRVGSAVLVGSAAVILWINPRSRSSVSRLLASVRSDRSRRSARSRSGSPPHETIQNTAITPIKAGITYLLAAITPATADLLGGALKWHCTHWPIGNHAVPR